MPTSPDGRLLTLVALAGAIGATIFSLRSFAMYSGNRTLVRSWLPLYFVMPVVGALLGQLFYVILRAGLISPTAPTADVSPYGFAAIAGLGGLYSGQALERLKLVFEQIFAKIPVHNDPVVQSLNITGVSPPHGAAGATVTITGTGLSKVNRVVFSNNIEAGPGAPLSDTSLTVTVPAGATTGPIAVYDVAGARATSPSDFTVDP